MHISTIIVGQGLCGTWLSYWLQQAGASFVVIDEEKYNTATRVASGIVNPVTGRRMSKTWMAEELIPFAEKHYNALGVLLNESLIKRCDIIDFFSGPDRRLDFEKKATQFAEYLQWPEDENFYHNHFHYGMGYGIIAPAYQVDLQTMLQAWRRHLQAANALLEEQYHPSFLQVTDTGVRYKNMSADRIIFCDGVAAMEREYFKNLPFAFNRGEALIVSIPQLPANHIYKKGNTITPWQNGLFWVGSTYDNFFNNDQPTAAFREKMEAWLKEFIKLPFEVVDHLSAIRPATVERRPFVGFHPQQPRVGILNGMGTKGVTLAPFFGRQLADHILHSSPILPQADVKRFEKVLARG